MSAKEGGGGELSGSRGGRDVNADTHAGGGVGSGVGSGVGAGVRVSKVDGDREGFSDHSLTLAATFGASGSGGDVLSGGAAGKAGGGKRWVLPAVVGVLLALVVVSLCSGAQSLSASELWNGLLGRDESAATILWQIRLPRVVIALLTGAALSAGGVIMQAYFRNSLASPGLLGVSSGGAAGAAIVIGLGWTVGSLWILPIAAVIGAVLATGAVLILAKQGASTERLLLAGVALNALLGAVTSYVLSSYALTYQRNSQILFWLLGGLEDRTWEHVAMAAPIVVCAVLLWPLGRSMDLLSLGSDEAQSLGVDVRKLRRQLLVLSTVLAALATAVAGMVGFVGLIVPHVLRLLVGPEHRRLVPLSLLGGAAFVLGCDLIGRLADGMRLGIVTSLVGGPFFLWLLRRRA